MRMLLKHYTERVILLKEVKIIQLLKILYPCIKDVIQCMFNEDHVKFFFLHIPFSNNTVPQRINDIADDIESPVIEVKRTTFSTKESENRHLQFANVRYLNGNLLEKNLLLCYPSHRKEYRKGFI